MAIPAVQLYHLRIQDAIGNKYLFWGGLEFRESSEKIAYEWGIHIFWNSGNLDAIGE